MLNDPLLLQALAVGAVVALVGFGLVLPALRRTPMQRLQRGTEPYPYDPAIKAPKALGLSKWQSGIVGPKDKDPELLPYLGHHIIDLNEDRVVVRAGGGTHAWRFVLFVMILAIPLAVALALELQALLAFSIYSGGRCVTYVPAGDGFEVATQLLEPSVWNYVYSRACEVALIFDPNSIYPTLSAKLAAFINPLRFPFLLIFAVLLIGFLVRLRRTPAPLVFDRRRKLVYTHANGKLWAAPWDGLQMRSFVGPFTTTPAFALFENGNGTGRWFVLAGYHARKEFRAPRLVMLGLDWMKRWDGMRCWLVVFMEQGPSDLHGRYVGRGFGDFIAPRQANLPDDIATKVDGLNIPAGKPVSMPRSMAALMKHPNRVIQPEDCALRRPS
jgi:hypothetical protein